MNPIEPKIKNEILAATLELSSVYHSKNVTDLTAIANEEEISVHVDNYENYFDGMLVWDTNQFHIHLNSEKGNSIDSKRGRFSFAHELAHYFIESHREGIRKGLLSAHPSVSSLIHSEKMEQEADYFASCLLMPRERLKTFTGKRKFSFKIIEEVSESFHVSLTSALIRFAEVGTHEILVVFSKQNKVKWYCASDDFPKLPFRFKVGNDLPPTTVAGEYFNKADSKYLTVEKLDVEDWFYWKPWAPKTQLHEQCFYSDIYDYVISLVWFE
jgi:Zn-dependent peptidase ImmA (M78 family)